MIDSIHYTLIFVFLLAVMAVAAGFDLRIHKIPNKLTYPAMLAALAFHTVVNGWDGFLFSLAGLGAGTALLLLPYALGGMGAGDAKLMGVVGACLGARNAVAVFLFVAAIGCIYALGVVIAHRGQFKGYFQQIKYTVFQYIATRKYERIESASEGRPRVYYGIAIAAGTMLFMILEITGHQPLTI
jgi:prepilin peptidase CpaA